jgi:hypothetical protein
LFSLKEDWQIRRVASYALGLPFDRINFGMVMCFKPGLFSDSMDEYPFDLKAGSTRSHGAASHY